LSSFLKGIDQPPATRHPLSAFRFPLSAFRFPLSAFRFQVSGFRLQVSGCRFQVSGFSRPPPAIRNAKSAILLFVGLDGARIFLE
jgi:hypothetical protein